MEPEGDRHGFALPPALLARLEAAAREEQRSADELVNELVEQGLGQRQLRAEILARVDRAETSLAQGEGTVITEPSMRQLATDVKQRGRARLAAEDLLPR